MKHLIPFLFPASVLEKRRRSYRDEIFLSSVEVDIPVATGLDAPVVATATDTDGLGSKDRVFRHFDDGFYTQVKGDLTIDDLLSGKAALGGPHGHWYSQRADELLNEWNAARPSKAGDVIGGDDVRDWGRESRDEFRSVIENATRGFLSIDGTLWQRCPEPRIVIDVMYANPRPCLVVTPIDDDRNWTAQRNTSRGPYDNRDFHNPLWQTYFRLDELNMAEDWLRSRGVVFTTPFTVEIFDDGVFQFDRAEDIARRMASAFLNGVTQEFISQSDRFIDVWKYVRRLASDPLDLGSQGALVTMVAGAAEDIAYEPLRAKLLAAAEDWSTNAALAKAAAPTPSGLMM